MAEIPKDLEEKIKAQKERLESKPDSPKEQPKGDTMISSSELPAEVEADLKAFSQSTARGTKAFDVMVTNYIGNATNEYGISKDSSKFVAGLETEMIKAYGIATKLSAEDIKAIESSMKLGGSNSRIGLALASDFRRLTGFNQEFRESLLEQKTLNYQQVKKEILDRSSKSFFGNMLADSTSRFAAAVTTENWKEFKSVPLTMAKKLGLEDQIDTSNISHRGAVTNLYEQLFVDYANRFRTKYLN